ncbi:polygalacturonase inhibitor-like [Andrographis paniculata]|uniref:polygalacturonase inhibitor-like n=1 Tax=Andrographis paniculata TaxID=175694 RepID=UPI0021E7D929|nr:polygalacturonase inhibitor-like [Andrographis paniculata]
MDSTTATAGHFLKLLLLLLLFSSSEGLSERCHPDDKKALLRIKKDLNSPRNFISWDPSVDCCQWNIIECDPQTNRVVILSVLLADLNLPMPLSVGDLSHLEQLIFHKTNLTGPIPQTLSRLSKLRFLDLTWNHLTGPVPSFLGDLKNLDYIGLSFNNLTGSIPASLSQLPKLTGLLLDRNGLTGGVPKSLADFQAESFYLYLSHNQLSGTIPRRWGEANFFTYIDMSRNRIEGDISFLFGKNKSLNFADFSRNMLQFDMSKMELGKRLGTLNVNHNRITGRLPEGLVELENIDLNVSYNRLCGRIPVGENRHLQSLDYTAYFHNKCLCGEPLPECA